MSQFRTPNWRVAIPRNIKRQKAEREAERQQDEKYRRLDRAYRSLAPTTRATYKSFLRRLDA